MRKTHLDVASLTIAGTDYKTQVKSCNIDLEVVTASGRAVTQRYGQDVPVKKRGSFSVTTMRTVTGTRQTNLSISVFTVGGTDYLGKLRSYTLNVTTVIDEASGLADEFESPQSTGTDYNVTSDLLVETSAALTKLIADAGVTGLAVQVVLTGGGGTISLPMILTASTHRTEDGKIQVENVRLSHNGTPTSVTATSLLTLILTGAATATYSLDYGSNSYAGDALCTSATVQVSDGAIIDDTFNFTVLDNPVATAPA
jgi:hypothetical protein